MLNKNQKKFFIILFIFGLVALLPTLIVSILNIANQREMIKSSIENEAFRLAKTMASQEQKNLDTIKNVLISLSKYAEISDKNNNDCNRSMKTLLDYFNEPFPLYFNLTVANINGDVICSALDASGNVNLSDRYYFRQTIETEDMSFSGYSIGRITKKPALLFSYPIKDESGRINLVAVISINIEMLNKQATNLNLLNNDPSMTMTLLDDKNYIIIRQPENEDLIGTIWPEGKISNFKETQEGVGEGVDLDGVKRIFGFTTIPQESGPSHFNLLVGLSQDKINKEIIENKKIDIIIFVAGIIIAVLSSWLVGKKYFE
ncbi:MAG: cache domain-containing protein [Candidatus Paceibacterota bacterium]|jgi:hypothetical protein